MGNTKILRSNRQKLFSYMMCITLGETPVGNITSHGHFCSLIILYDKERLRICKNLATTAVVSIKKNTLKVSNHVTRYAVMCIKIR
jgi:hypothetical protein